MMYAKASEISCDRDIPTGRLRQRHSALMENGSEDIVRAFWQQWQELQDQLYRYCLRLMNFNATDAEDVLSQAMLKAWEKAQQYAGKINNLKAWLIQLTRNLCIDIIRERSRGAAGIENIEWASATENIGTASRVENPEKALETEEKVTVIRQAIASLPERFRETFVLHFYQQRTHQEIAQAQEISYDNVCKRISLARKLLKEKLSGYFRGEPTEKSPQSTPLGKKPQKTKPEITIGCAIAPPPPKPENVPEVVEEKPQRIFYPPSHQDLGEIVVQSPPSSRDLDGSYVTQLVEEESWELENQEVSKPDRRSEVRSPVLRVVIALCDSTIEEKETVNRLAEKEKGSGRSHKSIFKRKPPQKPKHGAIARSPPKMSGKR